MYSTTIEQNIEQQGRLFPEDDPLYQYKFTMFYWTALCSMGFLLSQKPLVV